MVWYGVYIPLWYGMVWGIHTSMVWYGMVWGIHTSMVWYGGVHGAPDDPDQRSFPWALSQLFVSTTAVGDERAPSYSIQIHTYVNTNTNTVYKYTIMWATNIYKDRDTWPHTNNHTWNTIINWVQSGSCSIYSVCFPFSPCNTMLLSLYTYCIRLPIHIIEHSHKDFDKQFLRSSDAHCRNIFSHQLHL